MDDLLQLIALGANCFQLRLVLFARDFALENLRHGESEPSQCDDLGDAYTRIIAIEPDLGAGFRAATMRLERKRGLTAALRDES